MQEQLIGALRRALGPAVVAVALPAGAVVLGEVEIRSALGEALDARIPLEQADAQVVDASCFSLVREAGAGLPSIGEGVLTVERSTGSPVLRVRSLGRIYEPAVMLRVRAACPGQVGYVLRQYSLLIDPRPGIEVVTAPPLVDRGAPGYASESPAGAASAVGSSTIASLRSRSGDTLRSIASAVFPRNRQARAQYLAALREANPAFATQAENEPLPEGAPVALPDLRTYARAAIDASRTAPRRERASAPTPAARPAVPETQVAIPQRPRARPEATASAPPARAAAAARGNDGFVLKLSSAEVNLDRSRAVDERVRSQLRERLLVLDSDDQVSALLAMRNSLRQLESRVNELQLKLAAMPPGLASVAPRNEPAAPIRPIESPAPAPAIAPPLESTPPANTATGAITPAPVLPGTTAEPAAVPPAASPEPQPAPRARPSPRTQSRFELSPWLWGLVALLTAVALLLAWSLRRRKLEEETYEYDDEEPLLAESASPEDALGELDHDDLRATASSQPAIASPQHGESSQLRQRYIEERFPEVANRTIVLEDADSVVKGARLFYQDGAVARAVELLQFAIEEHPGEVRYWLALFEIYRLENLTAEFASLAGRFRARHEKSGYWLKVQYIGREIDAGNPLYRDESFSKLETIGPSAARRLSAATFDPIAENWLNAPMDFQNQVLASELRRTLMVREAVAEQDLVPNPMPALRNVELFTLA